MFDFLIVMKESIVMSSFYSYFLYISTGKYINFKYFILDLRVKKMS